MGNELKIDCEFCGGPVALPLEDLHGDLQVGCTTCGRRTEVVLSATGEILVAPPRVAGEACRVITIREWVMPICSSCGKHPDAAGGMVSCINDDCAEFGMAVDPPVWLARHGRDGG